MYWTGNMYCYASAVISAAMYLLFIYMTNIKEFIQKLIDPVTSVMQGLKSILYGHPLILKLILQPIAFDDMFIYTKVQRLAENMVL